jgi:hypothetical protein
MFSRLSGFPGFLFHRDRKGVWRQHLFAHAYRKHTIVSTFAYLLNLESWALEVKLASRERVDQAGRMF